MAAFLTFVLAMQPVDARASGADQARIESLLQLRALDEQVTEAGYRLAAANSGLCPSAGPIGGISVHDLAQYGADFRDAAIRAFGLDKGPAILAVARDSAAARAGLQRDDILVAIDGAVPDPSAPAGRKGVYDGAERLTAQVERALADGHAELIVRRGGATQGIAFTADRGCPSRFQVVPSKALNAGADGDYVQLSSALAAYAADADELAAILAHELAHNILRHRARLDEARVSRGILKNFGRNARLIRETEIEADRLSVRLMVNAGYDPAGAVRFWKRFGREHGHGIFASATHPGWRKRVATLEAEIAAIAAAAD